MGGIQEWLKTGIGAASTALVIFLWKNAKPYYRKIQRVIAGADAVDTMRMEVHILKAKQMSFLYVSDSAIFITNDNGEVVFVNAKWLKITGMPSEKDAYNFGYMSVIADETEVEKIEKKRESLLKHPGTDKTIIRFKHYVTGEIIVTECVSEPFFYEGKLIETVGRLTVIM